MTATRRWQGGKARYAMAQIDSNATLEQIAQAEYEQARWRKSAEAMRRAELARLSEVRETADEHGSSWVYVVVDDEFARILSCETCEELLVVPDQLEGYLVKELAPEALSGLTSPREIRCCDGIAAIGAYAFRSCENLERLVLPTATSSFSGSWVAKCPNLKELVLPDALETLTYEIFSNPVVRSLVIGSRAAFVEHGAFGKSKLEHVRVSGANENLRTDGTCLYTYDGSTLVALARPVSHYDVAPGCKRIARKAFVGLTDLASVTMPDSVELIDDLAFARSGITQVTCPAALREIGDKAFLGCKALEVATLNDGLCVLGENAFANTALRGLRIPPHVEKLGRGLCSKSNVVFSGDEATFKIDSENPFYFIDGEGCLYRREADGIHLAEMLEPGITSYVVKECAIAIDARAFAYHNSIEEVDAPEGLKAIGESAFRVCRNFKRISIPDSLESIGTEAFIDTSLREISIPLALTELGNAALVTDGAHHEGPPPSLRVINVAAGHAQFYMHTGMLCRRRRGNSSVVMFTSSCESVEFPEDVVEVEDYALNNAFGIRELHLNARLRTIGACGLSVMSQIRNVRIDVARPIEGISSFVLRFPASTHSVHGFLLALGGMGHLHMPDIMAQYDTFIAAARDYNAPENSDNATAYEQVKLIVDRLNSTVLLTEANRRRYHAVLDNNLEEICVDIARHDDRVTMGQLADLGVLNEENLERVIGAVGKLQDAAMTGYLLEMKRVRFSRQAFDFDL